MDTIPPSLVKKEVSLPEDGDAAWERIIADPRPRPKLEVFMQAALGEGSGEPLDENLFA